MRSRKTPLLLAAALLAFCSRGLFAGTLPFVGYDDPNGGSATALNNGGVVSPQTADSARNSFLGDLNGYYYEDFQEAPTDTYTTTNIRGKVTIHNITDGTKLSDLNGGAFNFQFSKFGSIDEPGLTGQLTSTDDSLRFEHGLVNDFTNPRGDFSESDTSDLANPLPGTVLADSANWYLDTDSNKNGDTLTLTFNPGQNAVGLELNDIVQPGRDAVTVNFNDGTSDSITAEKANGKATTLGNNNVWFFGVINPDSTISSVTITLGNDPITLDNIYVSDSVVAPLPASGLTALVLLGAVIAVHSFRRKLAF